MDERRDMPDELEPLVRDGLQHLFDPSFLQTHPLAAFTGAAPSDRIARGRLVRQALLDAIQALHPGASVTATSTGWRAYRILELRYVGGHDVAEVARELALSKRQFHRVHSRALQAVTSVLRERWGRVGPPAPVRSAAADRRAAELTRLEARSLLLDEPASAVDLVEVLQGVRDLVKPLCATLGATIRLELPAQPVAVTGERVALRQALLAVIVHALRAAPGSGLVVRVDRQQSLVEVEIRGQRPDDPETLSMGLRECQPFVEALGGSVELSSRTAEPAGSTIALRLPAADRPVLLVVDNSPDFVRLVERYLAGYDWQVLGTGDVDQAFQLARQRRPSVIVLDAVIPGRDGWELLLELKRSRETRQIPVVLCSVLDEPGLALSLGAASYLHKPIDQAQLVGALSRFR
jgi:CheY-like chemotaxis protein